MKNEPELKNRYTGDALKDALLLLARSALNSCGTQLSTQHFNEELVATALRCLDDPAQLTVDEYARILYLKTGIAMLHCKKEIYLAAGDIAKAEEALRSGAWTRGKLF